MPYQYSFDRTTLGNLWWYKSTYVFYQKGLKRLRTLLDAWKEKAGTDNHPYEREVRDLTTMIEWGDDRLKQVDDTGEIHISGITRAVGGGVKSWTMLFVPRRSEFRAMV